MRRIQLGMTLAALGLTWSAGVSAEPLSLHLVCHGIGDHAVTHASTAGIFGSNGGSAYAVGTSQQQVQFGEQMDVEIAGNTAKARVPRRFLPKLHGGDGGVFDVNELTITDDTITGVVLINFVNHPKLRIDRRTGGISLDGKVGSYAGECQRYDPAEQKRAF